RPADVDLLDDFLLLCPRGDRLSEGVKVHDHEGDGLNARSLEVHPILRQVEASQDPAMDARMKRFDSSAKNLLALDVLGNLANRDVVGAKVLQRATCRKKRVAKLHQRPGEGD